MESRYVTYLEDRVRKLETEMAGIPSSSRAPTMKSTKSYEAESGKITHLDSRQSDITQPPLLRPPSENKPPQDLPPELLPQSSDGFDWVEEEFSVDEISDGMAALSVRPEGAGYLGNQSFLDTPKAALLLTLHQVHRQVWHSSERYSRWDGISMFNLRHLSIK